MNKKEYMEIEFDCGATIDECVERLLRNPKTLLKGEFNGHMLYSDTVTIDSAYLEITGMTKADKEEKDRKWLEDYEKEKQSHKDAIPN